ncbi:MAG: hypothetical protein E6300_07210 [Clostridium sp.]|uniref:hypothetical protein n=1 Tax=Clostridium sp. TaxID=1506 RepID=UPI0029155524|nr:hypothetical protein [Clostridium sp.]MDU7148262.1 hypothetical protein [Clostridium sp.]MDU7240973.1 hypothetical protein [Clostridium sp.]
MKKDGKIVKLIEVEEFKEEMKIVEEYCKFVRKTLRTISKMEQLNSNDIDECIEKIDSIETYAHAKANGDELKAKMSFIFGSF